MNTVKEYKQYFTPFDLADFMVRLIPDCNINTVIDLSMGECGLLEAAKKRWDDASYFGVDIDEALLSKIQEKSPYINMIAGDGLSNIVDTWDGFQSIIKTGGFDVAIANPPFNYFDQSKVKVGDNKNLVLPIEIRFLLKYLDIVRNNGYICIILPYGFLSLDLYDELREYILKQATILKIIKIFDNCFERIDAGTCLMLLRKKSVADMYVQENISIEYLDSDYLLKKGIIVNTPKGNSRLDLEYHQFKKAFNYVQRACEFPICSLEHYVVSCKRGRTITKKEDLIVDKGIRFLHTTDVKCLTISNRAPRYVSRNTAYFEGAVAKSDNILIGRVGKACIGKIAIIPKNRAKVVISDCLFCLEIKDIDPYYLTLYIASSYGQIQLKGLAKGSCSKYITKKDLLKLKIIIPHWYIQKELGQKYMDILSRRGGTPKETLLKKLVSEVELMLGRE